MALQPVADTLAALSSPVHQIWFPYALAPTIHAARVSIGYQANARRSPDPLSWGTYITGYLIMVCIEFYLFEGYRLTLLSRSAGVVPC